MSAMDDDASLHSARLGERLLRLIMAHSREGHGRDRSGSRVLAYLWRLSGRETIGGLLFVAILAALCGTGVLFLLNAEAKETGNGSYSTLSAILFLALLVVYRTSQNSLIRNAASAIETALERKRKKVVGDVLQLSLRDIEAIGGLSLRDGISAHYGSLSQTVVPIIAGVESLLLLVFMFGYVLSLSVFAGVLTLIVVGLSVVGYVNRSKLMEAEMIAASAADARFRGLTDAIAGGAKELQLSVRRRLGLEAAIRETSAALANGRTSTAAHIADLISTATTISYMMAGAVVFLIPLVGGAGDSDISRIVIGVIFLLGPIGSVVQTSQQFATAQYALGAINAFEADVAARRAERTNVSADQSEFQAADPPSREFDAISMTGLGYDHAGTQSFAIEDIDLTLRKGEIVFLTGGNGSGKTTLLRVLTGLYPRTRGALCLNGEAVPTLPPQDYRELFSAVFADFYLFDRPFGLGDEEMSRFGEWLLKLGIRDKLGDDLEQLAADQLSTGQRKRVALALALAEARPILVLDEWAADQDPETRQRFYEEILPALRDEGLTIFAITHDEQYFHRCDRRIHMVEGRLVQGDRK